jgi:hypothetical protein
VASVSDAGCFLFIDSDRVLAAEGCTSQLGTDLARDLRTQPATPTDLQFPLIRSAAGAGSRTCNQDRAPKAERGSDGQVDSHSVGRWQPSANVSGSRLLTLHLARTSVDNGGRQKTQSSKPRAVGGLARLLSRPGRPAAGQERPASAIAGVVLHVVIRLKIDSSLDGPVSWTRSFELKSIVSDVSGRDVSEFGTVRPRVQIPGPRPISEFEPESAGVIYVSTPLCWCSTDVAHARKTTRSLTSR